MEVLFRTMLLAVLLAYYLVLSDNNRPTIRLPIEKTETVTYMDKNLTVSMRLTLDYSNNFQYIATSVIHPAGMHGVPDRLYKGFNDYVTQAIYPDNVKLVVYVKHNRTTGIKEFLGAKPPPTAAEDGLYGIGDPRLLCPNKDNWFITYNAGTYQVVLNHEGGVIDVFRILENKRPPFKNPYSTIHVHFAGVRFKLYKDEVEIRIKGADVDHDGQSHAGSSSGSSAMQ